MEHRWVLEPLPSNAGTAPRTCQIIVPVFTVRFPLVRRTGIIAHHRTAGDTRSVPRVHRPFPPSVHTVPRSGFPEVAGTQFSSTQFSSPVPEAGEASVGRGVYWLGPGGLLVALGGAHTKEVLCRGRESAGREGRGTLDLASGSEVASPGLLLDLKQHTAWAGVFPRQSHLVGPLHRGAQVGRCWGRRGAALGPCGSGWEEPEQGQEQGESPNRGRR